MHSVGLEVFEGILRGFGGEGDWGRVLEGVWGILGVFWGCFGSVLKIFGGVLGFFFGGVLEVLCV